MFSEGKKTTHLTNFQNVPEFSIAEPLNSPKNVCAVEHAIKCKIPPVPQYPFTTNLSALAQLAHAGLLLALAQRSSVVPMYQEGGDQRELVGITFSLTSTYYSRNLL